MDDMEPLRVPYKSLENITGGFCPEQMVGKGTFGDVYKGKDAEEKEIAVKRLKIVSGVDDEDFDREFKNLAKLKHPNIIQLLGYCNEMEEVLIMHKGKLIIANKVHRALCFEYMRHGSLHKYLSDDPFPDDKDKDNGIGWRKRYIIIKGMCEGLKYLQMGMKTPVYHLDLKPDNILLDENMVPKIADFGLSRLFGEKNTQQTLSAVGTIGYLPPEYINNQIISKQFDIYSLGVIIIKIMVGYKGYSHICELGREQFLEHVCKKWRERLQTIPGSTLIETSVQQVKTCIEIALQCVDEKIKRPPIDYIVDQLTDTEKHVNDSTSWIEEFDDGESIPLKNNIPARPFPEMATGGLLGTSMPPELPLEFLKEITNGFSDERKISEGAFGTVYKGILRDGQVIAVKKLAGNTIVTAGKQFLNAASNLMVVQHKNILRLLSCCSEAKEKVVNHKGKYILVNNDECILCYEYAPKGTLSDYLSDDTNKADWDTSFKIIKGICQGLHFLHKEMGAPIVHLDLQPANIWFDDDMVPKIGDFSLSRFFGNEQTRINTLNVMGTPGYMAPEYLYCGEISPTCDIYSLGILILEITTREKNYSSDKDMAARNFICDVLQTWTDPTHISSKYPSLSLDRLQEVEACVHVGFKCVDVAQRNRPSIGNVVDILNGKLSG